MHLYIKQKKIKKLILCSRNTKKIEEFKYLFLQKIKIISLYDININQSYEEKGSSFEENALIKTENIIINSNIPCISDDSGLIVKSLGGAPGIYSARYSSYGDDYNNINKLLFNMKNILNREAKFICVLCLRINKKIFYFFYGVLKGKIAQEAQGKLGFGYDSIFIPNNFNNKTLSQLSFKDKNAISHRYQAVKQCIEFLKKKKFHDK